MLDWTQHTATQTFDLTVIPAALLGNPAQRRTWSKSADEVLPTTPKSSRGARSGRRGQNRLEPASQSAINEGVGRHRLHGHERFPSGFEPVRSPNHRSTRRYDAILADRRDPEPASSATMLRMILRTCRAAASALTLTSLRGPSVSKTFCIVSRICLTRR